MNVKMKSTVNLIRTNLPILNIRNDFLRKMAKCACALGVAMRKLPVIAGIFFRGRTVISQIDLVVTTKCSLRCKHCADLMPYFKKPYDLERDFLAKSFDSLTSAIDYVDEVRVLGGESFVYRDLPSVLEYLIGNRHVGRVCVYTNGTIVPKDERLIPLLKSKKVILRISDYGSRSRNLDGLIAYCKENGIRHETTFLPYWLDFGGLERRNRTAGELRAQMARCNTMCHALLDGKFFYCERCASAHALGLIPDKKSDYVDLMDPSVGDADKREKILEIMYELPYVGCCDYCDKGTDQARRVPVAEQA